MQDWFFIEPSDMEIAENLEPEYTISKEIFSRIGKDQKNMVKVFSNKHFVEHLLPDPSYEHFISLLKEAIAGSFKK